METGLFVDLEICRRCPECVVDCSYFYHPHNNGITKMREKGTWEKICRQCEDAFCVESCPQEALEKNGDGRVERASMLCIRCRTCTIACPFGTMDRDVLAFLHSGCDLCEPRLDKGQKPVCVDTCPYDAVDYGDYEEDREDHVYRVEEGFFVHAVDWEEEEVEEK